MSVLSKSMASTENGSDKVYFVHIDAYLDGFLVNCQYGPRTGTLQFTSKTKTQVSMEVAMAKLEAVVAEKLAKGYVLTGSTVAAPRSAPISTAPAAPAAKSDLPMLLNPIDGDRLLKLMQDDGWLMQEKLDGHRRSVSRNGETLGSRNRKGESVPFPESVALAVSALKSRLPADFVLDGELMGDVFAPFDITRYTGIDLRSQSLDKRMSVLNGLLDSVASPALHRVRTAYTTKEKVALYDAIMAEGGEGVVFKKLDSKYIAGRPNTGGFGLKFKFLGSATCIVTGQNGDKSSIGVAVLKGKEWIEVGHVTIPPNHKMPLAGVYCEVEYMHLLRGGSLYQAVYKGIRDDKTEADQYETLRFKGEAVSAAPAPLPIHIRPTVAETQSASAHKAAATRKANAPAKTEEAKTEVPSDKAAALSAAANKAWATRRAKAAAIAAA